MIGIYYHSMGPLDIAARSPLFFVVGSIFSMIIWFSPEESGENH